MPIIGKARTNYRHIVYVRYGRRINRVGKLVGGVSKLTLQSSISLVFLDPEALSKAIYHSLDRK